MSYRFHQTDEPLPPERPVGEEQALRQASGRQTAHPAYEVVPDYLAIALWAAAVLCAIVAVWMGFSTLLVNAKAGTFSVEAGGIVEPVDTFGRWMAALGALAGALLCAAAGMVLHMLNRVLHNSYITATRDQPARQRPVREGSVAGP